MVRRLTDAYLHLFNRQQGFVATLLQGAEPECTWILLEMPGAAAVVAGEEGTHLFYPPHENVLPVQVTATPLSPQEDPQATVRKITRIRQTWRADVAAGKAQADSDPFPLAPIVRVYDPAVGTLDLRTLLLCANLPTATELRRFLLAGLPLPEAIATSA